MQSHTACSWGCKIWRSVAETQRPLPAPEVSNTPQGYSFLMFFEIWCAWFSFVFLQLNNCKIPFMFLHVMPCATFGGRAWHFGPIEPRTISNHAALCFVAVNDATFAMQFPRDVDKTIQKHRTPGVWKESGKTSLLKVTICQIQVKKIQPKQPRPENWVSTTGQGPLIEKMSKTLQRTHGRKESHWRWVDTNNDNNAVCVCGEFDLVFV